MKIVRLDRRYSMCRFNDYHLAIKFKDSLTAYPAKVKLQDHYGPTSWSMFNNPCPWYNEYYHDYSRSTLTSKEYEEVIYLREESMLTFLHLQNVL